MSKLPPLPIALAVFANTGILRAALDDIVSEYGQQCRDAALEQAAKVCDELKNESDDLCEYAAHIIRGLK